ncbi:MAG TPA: HAMP domain-containing sensor histidine kinase [Micrococcaceae bacterium]|jgi:two-component system sensor histidine kinase BaeS|nr:HAMP domain-containing sensor histidine kinase [Micrococcaceae bacterium]
MKAWLRSLSGGITMVTAAVAILAVLVTGLVAFPLIRAAAVDQARQQLSRQADAFAATPVASQALDLRERNLLGPDNYELSTIAADGTVTGAAGQLLGPGEVRRVLSGLKISRTVNQGGAQLLVEARVLKRGGGIVLTRSLQDVNAASGQVLQRTLLALAAGLLIAVLAGTLLARWLSRPLVRTAAAARRMAAGERAVSLAPAGVTEVRDVGQAVNTLDHALLASEGRQREFLLSISHEIRTPLTALHGYAEAMLDGLVPAEEMAQVGRTLAAETDRLDGFVRDLLELARLEADDFALDVQPVDVAALLGQVEAAWRGGAAQAGVRLELRLELGPAGVEPLLVATDGQRLRQIIDGLVGNALRVTPAGQPLLLQLRLERPTAAAGVPLRAASAPSPRQALAPAPGATPGPGPWQPGEADVVAIDVRDSGPGLTAEDAAVAFERGVLFRRYAGQRPVGSGLGLSIAARLAERLGVRLSVEPVNPAEPGACFCLRLPRALTAHL